tara:strand:- start:242 stop:688 length:447 start_codon:yes stop_codon:yes gene_type:complete
MRKTIIFLTLNLIFIGISFGQKVDCGDGITYSNEKQTKYDKRLSEYPKIESSPTYSDGKDELNKLIESNLKVNEQGKDIIFRLNYMFTITCDGQIKDFKTLGDSELSNLTNIKDIIAETNGKWLPAKKDGKPVDCIYFAKKTIVGNKY